MDVRLVNSFNILTNTENEELFVNGNREIFLRAVIDNPVKSSDHDELICSTIVSLMKKAYTAGLFGEDFVYSMDIYDEEMQ